MCTFIIQLLDSNLRIQPVSFCNRRSKAIQIGIRSSSAFYHSNRSCNFSAEILVTFCWKCELPDLLMPDSDLYMII
ncbi:hypothetical protein J6590_062339 [Homalodisca vitripennis]|nr:hypothetical protein J6590_062339 [Homalodisca vitripennis]